jgi:hypothetical protein
MDAATIAWPLGAHGQQPAMPVIGFLHGGSPEPSVNPVAAFRKGLAEAGLSRAKTCDRIPLGGGAR